MDVDVVKEKYPGIEIDESLRGIRWSFSRDEHFDYPINVFDKGKYTGHEIADCEDYDYLYWAFNNMLCNERQKIVKNNLLDKLKENGYHYYKKELISAEKMKAERKRYRVENEIKKTGKIIGIVTRNPGSEYKDTWVDVNGLSVHISFVNYDLKAFYYNQFEYYLPVLDGKAKRIKNKLFEYDVEFKEVGGVETFVVTNFKKAL